MPLLSKQYYHSTVNHVRQNLVLDFAFKEKGLGEKRNGGSGIGGEPASGSFQAPFWNSSYAAEHCLNGELGLQVGPESYCTPSSKCRVQSKAFCCSYHEN
ncbi:hypothetical protein K7X08_022694 [Anisodus acutangulus]|uniref:Uncharacterized protein n=1 Tax=Anisodus acutangulus TaxID=402998 RepID=A0A9Q1RKK8_9SOLA|nr:hypothetical protein K7X08_022694 [Anisodus acutangulus]